jgi:hypothetical protein
VLSPALSYEPYGIKNMTANASTGEVDQRTCFVVSAFGSSADEQRSHNQVLRHLVQKVLEPTYNVVRADQIDDEGLITNQIIEHLLEDDLVIADLTGLNPNVFYEVAVRHAARKPIVHLITQGQEIPFDVANMRAVPYALHDPDVLEEAQDDLKRKVRAIEASDFEAAPNPVSAAHDVWLLRESEQPDVREAGDFLASLNELRDEVRALSRRVGGPAPGTRRSGDSEVRRRPVVTISETANSLARLQPVSQNDLAASLGVEDGLAAQALSKLQSEYKAFRLSDGKWMTMALGRGAGYLA